MGTQGKRLICSDRAVSGHYYQLVGNLSRTVVEVEQRLAFHICVTILPLLMPRQESNLSFGQKEGNLLYWNTGLGPQTRKKVSMNKFTHCLQFVQQLFDEKKTVKKANHRRDFEGSLTAIERYCARNGGQRRQELQMHPALS